MSNGFTFFIATSQWHKGAAIPTHFKALADTLVQRGHQVVILISGSKVLQTQDTNPEVYVWPSKRPTHIADALFLSKLIHRKRPHCLIANFGAVNVMMVIGWLMRVPIRIAYYYTLSQQIDIDAKIPIWKRNILRYRKRFVYKLCTHICPVSFAGREDLVKVYKVPVDKTYVLHTSLPDPGLSIDIQKNRYLIVCAGRLDRCKGQDIVIKSLTLMERIPLELRVEFLGDGVLKEELERIAQDSGVARHCIFRGTLPHDDVLQRMAKARMVLVPSRADCLPTVCIESLAVATPVIASCVGGIPEIIRDELDGYLVPPEDPKALANAIMRLLLMDDEKYQQMCLNARQRFLNQFEQKRVIAKQAIWFESIVKQALNHA